MLYREFMDLSRIFTHFLKKELDFMFEEVINKWK